MIASSAFCEVGVYAMKTPPYQTHSVKKIRLPEPEERQQALQDADYNLFNLSAEKVYIDLLTDSGTGAMSKEQWAALMKGDETYAGSESFERLETFVRDLTGYQHVFPVHQGRAAERILFSVLCEDGQAVPNNTHFDTTEANVSFAGAEPLNFPAGSMGDGSSGFRGNMDNEALASYLDESADHVPAVLSTITNNSRAGLPVSLQNLRETRSVCDRAGCFFFLDAARFAENAFWNRNRREKKENQPIEQVVREQFRTADGCLLSAKKDGLVNIGGLLCVNDDDLAEAIRTRLILTEGFRTYGGLAGRDLEAMRMGMEEVLDEDYLAYRADFSRELANRLEENGVPVIQPPALHAVYVRAGEMLEHLSPSSFPGQALAVQLYLEGGIRSVEIGSLMFGDDQEEGETNKPELIRLCLPRRVYTRDHLEYIVEVFQKIQEKKEQIPGLTIRKEPEYLRHFTAPLKPDKAFPVPE